jgi:hypothetical protein
VPTRQLDVQAAGVPLIRSIIPSRAVANSAGERGELTPEPLIPGSQSQLRIFACCGKQGSRPTNARPFVDSQSKTTGLEEGESDKREQD